MARIRTIKPETWTDGDVMDLSKDARLLWIGSWNFAMCDFGHVADDPRRLKMQVSPADDVMLVKVDGQWSIEPYDPFVLVDEIVASGRMARIVVDGRSYLHIVRFADHQKTEKRWSPRCPACKALGEHDAPPETTPNLSETPAPSARERKGGEGKGTAAAAASRPSSRRPTSRASSLPPTLAILQQRLQAHTALQHLRFDTLDPEQAAAIAALIELHGDDRLADVALRTLRHPAPTLVSAFISTWSSLPPPGATVAAVKPGLCPDHHQQLTPSGRCNACAIDQRLEEAQ